MISVFAQPLEGKELTGAKMYALVDEYFTDIGSMRALPFLRWFEYVRSIPYVSDIERFPGRLLEVVSRPKYLMDRKIFPKIDCKKKSVLIGAWARANGFPFRFVAVSDRRDKEATHVFPQVDFGRGWVNADATLPNYIIGQGQPVTFAAELQR